MSTYREPIRGWINNLYGPAGLSVGMGVGLIRVIQLDLGVIANVVPADMVVNSVIASAWEVAENFTKEGGSVGEVPVYNFEISRGAVRNSSSLEVVIVTLNFRCFLRTSLGTIL